MPFMRTPPFVGPQNYAIWIILGLVENACFLVAASLGGSVGPILLIISGTCCMITVTSIVVGLAVIKPKYRRTFWQRELFRDELTRNWSVDWVEGLPEKDMVRSIIFSDWGECRQHLDPIMVNDWLKEGWPRWQATMPEWFTPTWIESALAHMDSIARESPKAPSPAVKKSSSQGVVV
jgi:hypothetical protein